MLHCFTSGPELARTGLALGGYVSFSGVVTFKNADALRDIALAMPYDRLLVETDAPYLAPEPMRGKTNEPAFVAHTAARLAALRGVSAGRHGAHHEREFLPPVQEGAAPAPRRAAKRRMSLKVTILGTGPSGGVPRIGDVWGACDPANPKNRRRRCSLLVQREGDEGVTNVLVDTPPDCRDQLLDAGVGLLDGVLYTHDHADHTHGIDDLRVVAYNGHRRVEIYCDRATLQMLRQRFDYCFETPSGSDYPAVLLGHEIASGDDGAYRGAGRRDRCTRVPADPRARRDARLPLRRACLFARRERSARGVACRICRISMCGSSTRSATRRIRAISRSARRFPGSSEMKPKRAILTHMHIDLDYATLAARAASGRRAGL